MPIRECTWHFGGRRTRNRVLDVHASGSAYRWRACGCTTAAGPAMPIRPSKPWLGATPHLGMPRSASGRMAMYIPSSPPLRGRSHPAVRTGRVPSAALRGGGGPVGRTLGRRAVQPRRARTGRARPRRPMAFLPRIAGPERPPAEGWDGMHIPTLPRGTPSVQGGVSLRSRPQATACRGPPVRLWRNGNPDNGMRRASNRSHPQAAVV